MSTEVSLRYHMEQIQKKIRMKYMAPESYHHLCQSYLLKHNSNWFVYNEYGADSWFNPLRPSDTYMRQQTIHHWFG